MSLAANAELSRSATIHLTTYRLKWSHPALVDLGTEESLISMGTQLLHCIYGNNSVVSKLPRILPPQPVIKSKADPFQFLITTQAKRNLSSRSGIGGVRSAT